MSLTGSVSSSAGSYGKRSSLNGSLQNATGPPSDQPSEDESDVNRDIILQVLLPNGTATKMVVNSGVPMMDLLVHIAASSKLSPAGHCLVVKDENTGKVREFRPNQSVGSLNVDTVHLQPRMSKAEQNSVKKDSQPFELTNRLTINLPRGQKMVLRVSLQTKLSEIFTVICCEKNLDSFVHELRHAKEPDVDLDLEQTLQEYGLNEIKVVNIKAQDNYRGSDDDHSCHSTPSDSLPPTTHMQPPAHRFAPPSREIVKKKKGLKLGFKSGKKEKKKKDKGSIFCFDDSNNSTISGPPSPDLGHQKKSPPAPPVITRHKAGKAKTPDSSRRHTLPPEVLLKSDNHNTTLKKRHAPPPPPGGNIKINGEVKSQEVVTAEVGPVHQASMGTRVDGPSNQVTKVVNKPSAISGVSGSLDFKSDKRSISVHDLSATGKKEEVHRPRTAVFSSNENLAGTASLKVVKRRKAPAPPNESYDPTSCDADRANLEESDDIEYEYFSSRTIDSIENADMNKPSEPDVSGNISAVADLDLHGDHEDTHSTDGTIDDVNLAFENVIAEAEKVLDEEVYNHKSEMALFVENMRQEAETRATVDDEDRRTSVDSSTVPCESDTDTMIQHGSESHSDVNSFLEIHDDIDNHVAMETSVEASPSIAEVEPDISCDVSPQQEHTPIRPQLSLDMKNITFSDHNVDSNDLTASSNITADSGISQSYDISADHLLEEVELSFDGICMDSKDQEDDVSDNDKNAKDFVFSGDESFSPDNSVTKQIEVPSIDTKLDKNAYLHNNGGLPSVGATEASLDAKCSSEPSKIGLRSESPEVVVLESNQKQNELAYMKSSDGDLEIGSSDIGNKQSQSTAEIAPVGVFGVKLRHRDKGNNIVFSSNEKVVPETKTTPKVDKPKVEKSKIESSDMDDSKVFTLDKDDEMFDFEKIRQKALAAQKEREQRSGSVKVGFAGSRRDPEVKKRFSSLSFKPRSEEETEHVLEEKSIMMMSRPVEIKSAEVKGRIEVKDQVDAKPSTQTLKSSKDENVSPAYKTSAKFRLSGGAIKNSNSEKCDDVEVEVKTIPASVTVPRDEVQTKKQHQVAAAARPISLATLMLSNLPPKVEAESDKQSTDKPPAPDDPQKLQQQLSQLQEQFSTLQKQYEMNQKLLAQQNILRKVDDENSRAEQQTEQPSSVQSPQPTVSTTSQQSNVPPPPPPLVIKSTAKPAQSNGKAKKFEKQLDPREELMIAIRNVGGRTALKKVPVRDANWCVTVYK